MGQREIEQSVFAQRLGRQALTARCYAAGETELGDEGNRRLDDPMGPWGVFAADAESALARSERGAA